jgi:uncharacterized low-complexity protein
MAYRVIHNLSHNQGDLRMSKDKSTKSWFGRHKILTVIGGIIVIAIIASAAGSNKSKTTSTDTAKSGSTTKSTSKAATAKIGEPASDGKFQFTVTAIKCGEPSVTDSSGYVSKAAQGQYCLVTISVKNIGDKQQLFSEDDQKLLNASNQQYSPDTTATLYNSNNSDVFVSEINPGNTVSGVLVYDIPKDQVPVTAELHDSSLSDGVKVNLQ